MFLAREYDEEMALIDVSDSPDSQNQGRQRMSRFSIGVWITVFAVLSAVVFASRVGGSVLGTTSQDFQGKAALGSWQGESIIDDILDSSKATTRRTEHTGMTAHTLDGLMGVLETKSQRHTVGTMGGASIEHSNAVATMGTLSINGTGEESRPHAALASVTMKDGKVTDKHMAEGQEALKELAEGSGNMSAVLGGLLGSLDAGAMGGKIENPLASTDAMLAAMAAAEKGVMNHTDGNPLAAVDAMLGAMEHASTDAMLATMAAAEKGVMNHTGGNPLAAVDAMMGAMEHAENRTKIRTDDPFAAMDAMMGAMTDMGSGVTGDPEKNPFATLDATIGSLQVGEKSDKGRAGGNPLAGLDALAATMNADKAASRHIKNEGPFAMVNSLAEPVQDKTF